MGNKEYLHQDFGKRVRSVRKYFDLLQKDFAESLDISATSLSDVEKGKFKPSIELLMAMCLKYNVNLYYILFGDDSMFLTPIQRVADRVNHFAVNIKDVREFFYHFQNSDILQYRVMDMFKTMMKNDKKTILPDDEA